MFDQWLTIAGAAGAVLAVVCAGVLARRVGVLDPGRRREPLAAGHQRADAVPASP